jgi:hypothetical protein
MYRKLYLSLPLFFFLAFSSCKGPAAPERENPVARVYNNYLYASDLNGIGKGLSAEDSAYQAQTYIDKWIMDQLVLGVALKNLPKSEEEKIDRLVEEYRASLIVAYYEQELINMELDTVVNPMQLAEYYTKNKEQYIAGIDWVRCFFIRLPRDLEGVDDVRRWFRSGNGSDVEKLKQFCVNNEDQVVFAIEEDRWLKLDKVVARLPEKELSDKYLQPDRVYDRSTDKYIYLYKTFEHRDKEDAAPLSQVQDEISRIIMHQRRQKILDALRQGAFEKAKEGGVFERF